MKEKNSIILQGSVLLGKLYDRADIYDLIESDARNEVICKDWEEFLGDRKIDTVLDVSIGSGGLTLPLQELGKNVFGSDLSEDMLAKCATKADIKGKKSERTESCDACPFL